MQRSNENLFFKCSTIHFVIRTCIVTMNADGISSSVCYTFDKTPFSKNHFDISLFRYSLSFILYFFFSLPLSLSLTHSLLHSLNLVVLTFSSDFFYRYFFRYTHDSVFIHEVKWRYVFCSAGRQYPCVLIDKYLDYFWNKFLVCVCVYLSSQTRT